MFHSFQTSIAGIELPRLFTYPFHYTPHPLCVMAAGEVQAYINKQTRWKEELDKGKMFGVLIVRTSNGQTGYLAAFSGNLCGSNSHSFFRLSITKSDSYKTVTDIWNSNKRWREKQLPHSRHCQRPEKF